MSKLSKLSSSKRFKNLEFYKSPKPNDLADMVARMRQMMDEHPGQDFMLNDDALSMEERKEDPEGWKLMEQALEIVKEERKVKTDPTRMENQKEVSTIVSFRLAGKMTTDTDCFIGVLGAPNEEAAMLMSSEDVKAMLAEQHHVSAEDVELCGQWGEREEREPAAKTRATIEDIRAPSL